MNSLNHLQWNIPSMWTGKIDVIPKQGIFAGGFREQPIDEYDTAKKVGVFIHQNQKLFYVVTDCSTGESYGQDMNLTRENLEILKACEVVIENDGAPYFAPPVHIWMLHDSKELSLLRGRNHLTWQVTDKVSGKNLRANFNSVELIHDPGDWSIDGYSENIREPYELVIDPTKYFKNYIKRVSSDINLIQDFIRDFSFNYIRAERFYSFKTIEVDEYFRWECEDPVDFFDSKHNVRVDDEIPIDGNYKPVQLTISNQDFKRVDILDRIKKTRILDSAVSCHHFRVGFRINYFQSKIDQIIRINQIQWGITMIAEQGKTYRNGHAKLIIEGVDEEGSYFMMFAHLCGENSLKVKKIDNPEGLRYEGRTKVFRCAQKCVQLMLETIERQCRLPTIQFELMGRRYHTYSEINRIKLSKDYFKFRCEDPLTYLDKMHNCTSWALSAMNIAGIFLKKRESFPIATDHTISKELWNRTPRELWEELWENSDG